MAEITGEQFKKALDLSEQVFNLHQSKGVPKEIIDITAKESLSDLDYRLHMACYEILEEAHKMKSRKGMENKFIKD